MGSVFLKIISYYESCDRAHWLGEIGKCGWRAGAFLYELLTEERFFDTVGEGSELLLLTDNDRLVSFCTFAERDEIDTNLSPWIGFVYTFPEYRGHRYAGLLFAGIAETAKARGIPKVFVSTDHIGLYEKYGFEYITDMKSIYGNMARVYVINA